MTHATAFHGFGRPCTVIAEVGQSHDGSLGTAHAFIDAAADARATGVKFQTHIADAESTPGEPWRVKFSPQDETRYDYWRRMEFSEAQWKGLRDHAGDRGLLFVSSPFSPEAVELLEHVGIDIWKIASGEVSNIPLLRQIASTGLPVIVSSGMSPFGEVEAAIRTLQAGTSDIAVLQCTSEYPCPPERVGLNVLSELREAFALPVGLSDHSGTIFPSLAAVVLGATVIEVHITLSPYAFGPDVPASVTVEQFHDLTQGIRFIEAMLEHPVNKNEAAESYEPMRALFTKSIVARHAMEAGTVLRPENLSVKKPGSGIPAREMDELDGRRLTRAVAANQLLSYDDLEQPT